MLKRLEIIEPRVFLVCAPSDGVVLCEDCPHRTFRSMSDRSVPGIETSGRETAGLHSRTV